MKHQLKCHELNRVEDCDDILIRAPWIPSYDEWSKKIPDLKNRQPYFAPEVQYLQPAEKRNKYKRVLHHDASSSSSSKGPRKIVAFPRVVGQVDFLAAKNGFWSGSGENRVVQLPKGSWSHNTAVDLYSLGKRFLYGMLQRYMIDFSELVKDSVPELLYSTRADLERSGTYTIALHSRHPNGLDGCLIKSEKKCMKKILKNKPEGMPCKVFVLADRKCTISTLSNWLQLKAKCTVEVATHSTGTGTRDEHGPFAGTYRSSKSIEKSS